MSYRDPYVSSLLEKIGKTLDAADSVEHHVEQSAGSEDRNGAIVPVPGGEVRIVIVAKRRDPR